MKSVVPCDNPSAEGITSAIQRNVLRLVEHTNPQVVVCSTSGAAVTFRHSLGAVPTCIHVEPWGDGRWWADVDDRRKWSADTAVFHASMFGRYTVSVGRI